MLAWLSGSGAILAAAALGRIYLPDADMGSILMIEFGAFITGWSLGHIADQQGRE